MRHRLASKNTGGQTDVPRMTCTCKKDENTLFWGPKHECQLCSWGVWKTDGVATLVEGAGAWWGGSKGQGGFLPLSICLEEHVFVCYLCN